MKQNEKNPNTLLARYSKLRDRGDLIGSLEGVTGLTDQAEDDGLFLANALILQASIYRDLGMSGEASKSLDKALRIAVSQGLHRERADVLRQQSHLLIQMGKPKEAEALAFESLRTAREFSLAKEEVDAMACVGYVFENTREFQKALCWYADGLEVCDRAGIRERKATLLGDIGKVYGMIGQLTESVSFLKKALDLSKEIPYEKAVISSLYRLGDDYRTIKDHDKASTYYHEALKRSKKRGYRREEGDCLYRLGLLDIAKSNPDEAIEFLSESSAIYESIKYTRQRAFSLLAIGHALEQKVDIPDAMEQYFLAFETIRDSADQYVDAFIDIAESIAPLWQQLRYVDEATELSRLMEQLRGYARMSGIFEDFGRKEKIGRLARQIASLIERAKKMEGNIYSHSGLTIDFNKKLVTRDDEEITLSRDQWKILWCLWRKRPEPCQRNELLAAIDLKGDTETRTIDVQIYNIRTKIGHQYIPSIRGRGYRLLTD
jgi:tetratricopeptide (TPR) repeat protein